MKNRFTFLLVLTLGILTSCTKTNNTSVDYNPVINASRDYANVQQMTARLINTFFKMATDSLVLNTGYNPDIDGAECGYRKDTVSDSVFYSITYGSWGVIDPFSRRRGGEIFVELDGNLEDSLAKGTFSFKNFHYEFDSLKATGFEIQNMGNSDGHHTLFHLSASQMHWQTDSTHAIVWNFDQNFIREKGGNSAYFSNNDQYLISGTLKGTTTDSISFETVVNDSSDLLDNYHCAWLKEGVTVMNVQGFEAAQILFPPEGNCVNIYQLQINGNRFDEPIEPF